MTIKDAERVDGSVLVVALKGLTTGVVRLN